MSDYDGARFYVVDTDTESFSARTPAAAIREWLDGRYDSPEDAIGPGLTVTGYAPIAPDWGWRGTPEAYADAEFEDTVEMLDDDNGPDDPAPAAQRYPRVAEAFRAAFRLLDADYRAWGCDPVGLRSYTAAEVAELLGGDL